MKAMSQQDTRVQPKSRREWMAGVTGVWPVL